MLNGRITILTTIRKRRRWVHLPAWHTCTAAPAGNNKPDTKTLTPNSTPPPPPLPHLLAELLPAERLALDPSLPVHRRRDLRPRQLQGILSIPTSTSTSIPNTSTSTNTNTNTSQRPESRQHTRADGRRNVVTFNLYFNEKARRRELFDAASVDIAGNKKKTKTTKIRIYFVKR